MAHGKKDLEWRSVLVIIWLYSSIRLDLDLLRKRYSGCFTSFEMDIILSKVFLLYSSSRWGWENNGENIHALFYFINLFIFFGGSQVFAEKQIVSTYCWTKDRAFHIMRIPSTRVTNFGIDVLCIEMNDFNPSFWVQVCVFPILFSWGQSKQRNVNNAIIFLFNFSVGH